MAAAAPGALMRTFSAVFCLSSKIMFSARPSGWSKRLET
jgi:hypothetical protein